MIPYDRAKREAIVRAHCDAENRHDVAGTLATFRTPKYDVVPMGAIADGRDAVQGLLSDLMAGFPDFHVDVASLRHCDDAVVTEIVMTGTQRGPWAGIPATGKQIDVPSVAIFEFDGNDLLCEKVYFDFATLLRQLGVMA